MIDHDPRLQEAMELVGRRWSGAIVWALLDGPRRFNDLLNGIPRTSDRMLTIRLNELADEGVIERRVEPGPPTRVSYALTAKGRALRPVLEAVKSWTEIGWRSRI